MRIVVNNIAASKTGALSVLRDFYEYVKEHETEHEWIFLVGDRYIQETEHIKVQVMSQVKKSWLHRLAFDLFTGSNYVRSLQPDVFFSMQNTLPVGYRGRQIIYLHQPLGYQTVKKFSFWKKKEREYAVYQYLIGALIDHSVKKAEYTIVQTGWMQEAVAKKTGVRKEKIIKILPDIADLSAYREKDVWNKNNFFFPSGDIIYKNHECILKAVKLLQQENIKEFNIAFTLDNTDEVTEEPYDNRHQNITCMGQIAREEVFSYYNQRTLIFPSYIETFGYPLAEARQLNTLILASDCPFCHEILDGYENAYFFDPFAPEQLAELIKQVLAGKLIREETNGKNQMIQKNENSWKEIVKLLLTE